MDSLAPHSAPKISVIIPTYNAMPYILEQLEALEGQDYLEKFEVIISDNGSTDSLINAVEKYKNSKKFDLIYIDASQIKGPAYARNMGVANAHGDILLFCDADDIVCDNWVSLMLTSVTQCGAAAGWMHKFEGADPSRKVISIDSAVQKWFGRDDLLWPVTACFGITKQAYEKTNSFDETMLSSEDIDFGMQLLQAGITLGQSEAYILYRLRTSPRSAIKQMQVYGKWELIAQKRYEQLLMHKGITLPNNLTVLKDLLGHIRRFPLEVQKNGLHTWKVGFAKRLGRLESINFKSFMQNK